MRRHFAVRAMPADEGLMDLEISSSERYAESISAFDSAYEELTKRTLEVISSFFSRYACTARPWRPLQRCTMMGAACVRVVLAHACVCPGCATWKRSTMSVSSLPARSFLKR